MEEEFQSKDIYLAKEGQEGYVGLHSIGYPDEDGKWRYMQNWANSYDKDRKFQASIFRIFGPIEETVEDMEQEGWKQVEWPNENR